MVIDMKAQQTPSRQLGLHVYMRMQAISIP